MRKTPVSDVTAKRYRNLRAKVRRRYRKEMEQIMTNRHQKGNFSKISRWWDSRKRSLLIKKRDALLFALAVRQWKHRFNNRQKGWTKACLAWMTSHKSTPPMVPDKDGIPRWVGRKERLAINKVRAKQRKKEIEESAATT